MRKLRMSDELYLAKRLLVPPCVSNFAGRKLSISLAVSSRTVVGFSAFSSCNNYFNQALALVAGLW